MFKKIERKELRQFYDELGSPQVGTKILATYTEQSNPVYTDLEIEITYGYPRKDIEISFTETSQIILLHHILGKVIEDMNIKQTSPFRSEMIENEK